MKKRFLNVFSTLLVLAIAFLLIGCKKTNEKNPTEAKTGEKTPTAVVVPEINFTEKSVTVKLGETYKINVNIKNAKGTFEYEIADKSIVSVEDGVVKALKEGETNVIIKVTCDDEKKTSAEFTLKVIVIDDNKIAVSYSSSVEGFEKANDYVKPGEDFTLPENGPEVVGHTFVGWALSDGENPQFIDKLEKVTEPVTVYAIYVLNVYTITYELDGAEYDGPTVIEHGELIEFDSPRKEGYMFIGWVLEPGSKKYIFDIVGSKDITVYAVFLPKEYKITYDLDGGTYEGATKIEHDQKIELGTPTKDGYDFLGWTTERSSEEYITELVGSGNVTLYAHYEPKEYQVTFVLDGGTYDGETTVKQDKLLQLGTPVKEGYIFLGWSQEAGSTEYITRIYGRGPVTIYANWMVEPNKYEITYNLDGGAWYFEYYTAAELGELFMADYNEKTGSSLDASQLDTDCLSSNKFGDMMAASLDKWGWLVDAICEAANGDEALKAENADWSSSTVRGFYLANFNGFFTSTQHTDTWYETVGADFSELDRGQTVLEKAPLKAGGQGPEKYTEGVGLESIPTPARADYNFKHWIDSQGNVVESISATSVGAITLKAVWEAKPDDYAITYVLNGGEWVTEYYTPAELGELFVADFNAFTNAGIDSAADLDTDSMSGSLIGNFFADETNFAKWSWLLVAIHEAAEGDAAIAPASADWTATAARSFYLANLNGFFTSTQHKDTWWEKTSADWTNEQLTAKVIDVAPIKAGGEAPTSAKRGSTFELMTPSKEGYAFLGWSLEEGSTTYVTEVVMNDNVTVYANWIESTTEYTITYELDGGEYAGVDKVKFGEILKLGEATKTSYTFKGWALAAGSTEFVKEVVVKSDLTLYAIFEINTYKITYNLDGGEWATDYYTPAELGDLFLADFNAFANYKLTAENLDTDHMSGKKFGDFFLVEENLNKWSWLLDAICDLVGEVDTIRPAEADFTNDGIRGFYLANLNGFFTSTQHTDTWYESIGQDYSIEANSKAILEKGPTKVLAGPESYTETVGVESFPTPVKQGFVFNGWIDANATPVDSISNTETGDIALSAVWIPE